MHLKQKIKDSLTLILFLVLLNSYAQSQEELLDMRRIGANFIEKYISNNSKELNIVNNDTIAYMKGALDAFRGNPNSSDYLKKYVITDSEFFERARLSSPYYGRIEKRKDFVILFILYFELFLKYEQPEEYEILTIRFIENQFKEDFSKNRLIRPSNLVDHSKYKKIYMIDRRIEKENETDVLGYLEASLAISDIFDGFERWIEKIEKLGSLEKARKKGLDPFKDLAFRFNFIYIPNNKEGKNDYFEEMNSYYPGFPSQTYIESKELTGKHWSSSYKDSNKW